MHLIDFLTFAPYVMSLYLDLCWNCCQVKCISVALVFAQGSWQFKLALFPHLIVQLWHMTQVFSDALNPAQECPAWIDPWIVRAHEPLFRCCCSHVLILFNRLCLFFEKALKTCCLFLQCHLVSCLLNHVCSWVCWLLSCGALTLKVVRCYLICSRDRWDYIIAWKCIECACIWLGLLLLVAHVAHGGYCHSFVPMLHWRHRQSKKMNDKKSMQLTRVLVSF